MKIYEEIEWRAFDFTDEARENLRYMTDEQIDKIWNYLEINFTTGLSYYDINHFFTYSTKEIAFRLGFDCWEQLVSTHLMRKSREYLTKVDTPIIVHDHGCVGFLYCARIEGYTTTTACEKMCPHYSSCQNIADMDDTFKQAEYFGVL